PAPHLIECRGERFLQGLRRALYLRQCSCHVVPCGGQSQLSFLDPICQLIRLERTRLHTARQHPHELCRAEPGLFELNRVLLQRVQEVVVGRECVPLPERDQIPRLLPLKAERLNERRRLSEYLV